MTPSDEKVKNNEPKTTTNNLKVIKGKKLERKRKFRAFLSVIAVIASLLVIFQLILPMGIIENLTNTVAFLGSGSYPINLDSTETLNTVSRGQYYYVLTDSQLNAFSNSGKKIVSYAHGFENPILKTSRTRALIFAQGNDEVLIYNLTGQKIKRNMEDSIITANISDSGTYAVVTQSATYASAVYVYDKMDNLIYEWYSSEDMVNNIVVSPNGKKIAVSTINANSGIFKSKLLVLNYSSATAEYQESFDSGIIYTLDSFHNSGFSVIMSNKYEYIKWSKYVKTEYSNDYKLSIFRASSNGYVMAFNRDNDKTDNKIAIISTSGKLKTEFNYKGIISDIEIYNGNIYCVSDTTVNLLSDDGKLIKKSECGFGVVRIVITSTNTVAVLTDNKIEKIQLEQE